MNQTTVDSNKNIKEYSDTYTITFNVTEKTIEVPPQDKSYGSFSSTYTDGIEISAGDCEFDEKTGEIIEDNGTTHKVSKEEMKRYKEDSKRKLIAEIKQALKKLNTKSKKSASKLSDDIEK